MTLQYPYSGGTGDVLTADYPQSLVAVICDVGARIRFAVAVQPVVCRDGNRAQDGGYQGSGKGGGYQGGVTTHIYSRNKIL